MNWVFGFSLQQMIRYRNLNDLFYEDHDNPGMSAAWNTKDEAPKANNMEHCGRSNHFFGQYEYVDSWIYNYVQQISYAFAFWCKALCSVQFKKTILGNSADIT